jgi:hypothetical protein
MVCRMKPFRWVLGATLALVAGWQSDSQATVVKAIALGDLVSMSEWVVVATVKSAQSHYQTIGGSRRMVTDTILSVEQALTPNHSSGNVETATVAVRTLGGTIGDLAQYVPGEAILAQGTQQLLFLDEGSDGVLRVSAMAQGQYPLVADDNGELRLHPSPGLDAVINPEQSAVTTLIGRSVEQAQMLLQNARKIP